MRDVDARLTWMLGHLPDAPGRCAEHVMRALDAPPQGFPDATAVARAVISAGRMRSGACPRGAVRYWTGGSDGHGHVALEDAPLNGPAAVASTDVLGPRTVGVKPLSWFARSWPTLRYEGWSWWWGGLNTQPEEAPMGAPAYRNITRQTPQTLPLNEWATLDLGREDAILPPVGSNDWWFQVHLDLATLKGAGRNDLRYVKGRWARKKATGDDTHGTDTKAIPLDLPKASWQSSFSTDMKGLEGVPVEAQVFIGSMRDGTVVSPLRLFTIDDETT